MRRPSDAFRRFILTWYWTLALAFVGEIVKDLSSPGLMSGLLDQAHALCSHVDFVLRQGARGFGSPAFRSAAF